MKIEENWPDIEGIQKLAKDLPEYFTKSAVERIGSERESENIIALENETVWGFIIYSVQRTEAEIKWMAVRRDLRGHGIGSYLMKHLENILMKKGFKLLRIKTLDDSAGYEPYLSTNAFYRKLGFVRTGIISKMPGWDPGNPCAIYEKRLNRLNH